MTLLVLLLLLRACRDHRPAHSVKLTGWQTDNWASSTAVPAISVAVLLQRFVHIISLALCYAPAACQRAVLAEFLTLHLVPAFTLFGTTTCRTFCVLNISIRFDSTLSTRPKNLRPHRSPVIRTRSTSQGRQRRPAL